MEFSLTRNSSRAPWSASQRASVSTSEGRRLTNEPRKLGIAQNEQRRSQPLASLSGGGRSGVEAAAYGGGAGGVTGHRRGRERPLDRRDRQQLAAVLRRVRQVRLPRDDRAQPRGDVGVVVEAEHGVGLGQRVGELLAVPLGQAADRDHGLGAAGLLEVRGLQQRVDGVLLGGLDEPAGVHDHGVGVRRVVDQPEAVGLQPTGELLGVDLVAGAPEGHHGDRQRGRSRSRIQEANESSSSVEYAVSEPSRRFRPHGR